MSLPPALVRFRKKKKKKTFSSIESLVTMIPLLPINSANISLKRERERESHLEARFAILDSPRLSIDNSRDKFYKSEKDSRLRLSSRPKTDLLTPRFISLIHLSPITTHAQGEEACTRYKTHTAMPFHVLIIAVHFLPPTDHYRPLHARARSQRDTRQASPSSPVVSSDRSVSPRRISRGTPVFTGVKIE